MPPAGNRDPEPQELSACNGYLERQIEAIDRQVIVTLGRFSMAALCPTRASAACTGRPNGSADGGGGYVSPRRSLHQPSLKAGVEEDFAHCRALSSWRKKGPQITPRRRRLNRRR